MTATPMTRARPLLGAFFLAVALAGCSAGQRAALDGGLDAARAAKDAEALALKSAVCAMSLGAYHRVNSDIERQALDVLCGGGWDRPLTVEDLRLLRGLEGLPGGS